MSEKKIVPSAEVSPKKNQVGEKRSKKQESDIKKNKKQKTEPAEKMTIPVSKSKILESQDEKNT